MTLEEAQAAEAEAAAQLKRRKRKRNVKTENEEAGKEEKVKKLKKKKKEVGRFGGRSGSGCRRSFVVVDAGRDLHSTSGLHRRCSRRGS
jgi:hypothetical protein